MRLFSKKYGYQPEQSIQIESVSDLLRIRIWNVFYKHEIKAGGLSSKRITAAFSGEMTVEEKIADKLGFNINESFLIVMINKFITKTCEWYIVYDFIDSYICCIEDDEKMQQIIAEINCVLEEEKSGYRIVNNEIAPITNKTEIEEIESAVNTQFDSVNTHISKALELYANRKNPDYENSIKESISAVEAMCCTITENEKSSLGQALKKLEENGVYIHKSMKNAFSSLYGYASDESGIRHGSIDFVNAPAEDAKFMLVSCSAFVNYLIEKWSKVKE